MTIPDELWISIIEKGFDWIWLMGVWEHSSLSQKELEKHPGLIKEISNSLPKWNPLDVIGSPYSIVKYELNPQLGLPGDLKSLKQKLNDLGAKLMLDFVPNHFGSASELVLTNPEYFISTDNRPQDQSLFKQVETEKGIQWIAYGKDPYFLPWTDTFQLNYFNENTREYMITVLNKVANECDGVRCDMAMLCLSDIIQQTWGFYFEQKRHLDTLSSEFWPDAITTVKSNFPEFSFLAEVYWNLGWKLQQMGFDYTYDKDLYDLLENGSTEKIQTHLSADKSYLIRNMRFIENHDERRAHDVFGHEKSIAAAIIMGTVPGLSLYYQGQLEGEKIKIPVQLRQKQSEKSDPLIQEAYDRILEFTKQIKSHDYQWALLSTSNSNILAWKWYNPNSSKSCLVVVNYSSFQSQGNIFLPLHSEFSNIEQFDLYDILNEKKYSRKGADLTEYGLFVDLQPFQNHLFIVDPI